MNNSCLRISMAEDVSAHPHPSDLSLSVRPGQLPGPVFAALCRREQLLCQRVQRAVSSLPQMILTPRMESF